MWQTTYKEKLISVEEAAAKIKPGDRIYLSPGIGAPYDLMEAITERYEELTGVEVVSGQLTSFFTMLTSPEYKDHVKFAPYEYVLDCRNIAARDNMLSINGCVTVDLMGQVGSESIGPTQYGGVGGALDFVRGSRMSKGGRSFICTHSTYLKGGEIKSSIVSGFVPGQVVSIPRDDVMYIVTEYGVADLCCQPLEVRAERMIGIAHPDFREQLRAEAVEMGILQE